MLWAKIFAGFPGLRRLVDWNIVHKRKLSLTHAPMAGSEMQLPCNSFTGLLMRATALLLLPHSNLMYFTVGCIIVRSRLYRDQPAACQTLRQAGFQPRPEPAAILQCLQSQMGYWAQLSDRERHGRPVSSRYPCCRKSDVLLVLVTFDMSHIMPFWTRCVYGSVLISNLRAFSVHSSHDLGRPIHSLLINYQRGRSKLRELMIMRPCRLP